MPGSPHSHRPSTSWRRYSLREPSIQRVLSLPGLNPDDSALSDGLRTSISAVNLRHDRPATPEMYVLPEVCRADCTLMHFPSANSVCHAHLRHSTMASSGLRACPTARSLGQPRPLLFL